MKLFSHRRQTHSVPSHSGNCKPYSKETNAAPITTKSTYNEDTILPNTISSYFTLLWNCEVELWRHFAQPQPTNQLCGRCGVLTWNSSLTAVMIFNQERNAVMYSLMKRGMWTSKWIDDGNYKNTRKATKEYFISRWKNDKITIFIADVMQYAFYEF